MWIILSNNCYIYRFVVVVYYNWNCFIYVNMKDVWSCDEELSIVERINENIKK